MNISTGKYYIIEGLFNNSGNNLAKVGQTVFTLLVFLLFTACSKDNTFQVRGTVRGTDKVIIYLDEQDVTEIHPVDSARIRKNGSFSLKGTTSYPRFYNLHLGDQKIIPLLIGPGENLNLTCNRLDFSRSYTVTGSEGSEYLKMLNDTLELTRLILDSIQAAISNLPDMETETFSVLNEQFMKVFENQRRFSLEFVLNHPTSLASVYALYQEVFDETFVFYKNRDIQIMKITGQSLDTIFPESHHVRSLVAYAANLEMRLKNRSLQQLIDKSEPTLPEISLPNPQNDTITLSSLKGKVILLCFWASWNQKSREYNTHLLNLYNKYNSSGFEIYQVSFDNDFDAWTEAIRYDELHWINVCDLRYPESSEVVVYNISELPTTFLISKDWDIIGKNIPFYDLDTRINELLNK